MKDSIKKDIIYILSTVVDILESKGRINTFEIKNLSNHTIHNASVFQDEDSISIAVLVYAVSKIVEREGLIKAEIIYDLKKAVEFLKNNKFREYRSTIKKLFEEVKKIDSQLKLYIEEVISQAQIKKGSKLSDHGISVARASELFGISQWELMNYVGKTRLTNIETIGAITRLRYARGLFE